MNLSLKNKIPFRALLLSLALVALAVTGCRSAGKPASASFASVVIPDRSTEQIRNATIAVFYEDGYKVSSTADELVFEKEGSRLNTIARDGLVATQSGAVTLIRVRAKIVPLAAGSQRLQCQTYMVSGAGDSFFEEEHRLADFRGRPYQELLEEVAKRLK